MTPRLEREAVLAALTVPAVLARFGLEPSGRPSRRGEVRLRSCPTCGERGRVDAVGINLESGKWSCYAGNCKGDLLAAVAGWAGLNIATDFVRVLDLAADIAGVLPGADPAEVKRAAEERRRQDQDRVERSVRERRIAILRAGRIWRECQARSSVGEDYLRSRGLDPVQLAARGAVRFLHDSPAVALYSSAGAVINVVRRVVAPGDGPKCPGLTGCPGRGTLVGRLSTVLPGRRIVITEGVCDSLAAVLAWPGALVLGAHSWIHLEAIGQAVAKLVFNPEVFIVPHRDPPTKDAPLGVGYKGAHAAALHLTDKANVKLIYLEAKDLADAWKAGWRP